MFLKFQTQEERRAYRGSDFVEIQYCPFPVGTPEKKIVNVISHWALTSLYVEDENEFYTEYKDILGDGLYNNLKYGAVDLYGINYYSAEKVQRIMYSLNELKPKGYEFFLNWLSDSPFNNGFYILGL